MNVRDCTDCNYIDTDEKVVVRHVFTGYRQYHGDTKLGEVAVVRAEDNGGAFRFIPPRITVKGEKFFLVGLDLATQTKEYFRPFNDAPLTDVDFGVFDAPSQADPEPDIYPYETPSFRPR